MAQQYGNLVPASTQMANVVDHTIRDLQSTHLEYERKVHQLRKLRFMKTKTQAPRPFQRVIAGGVRSPLSYRLVQAITGMITKNRPTFKRLPMSKQDMDAASRLQASADPMLQDLERQSRRPLFYQYTDAVVADGRGVMKCYQDAWSGFPVRDEKDTSVTDHAYNQMVAEFVLKSSSHPLRMRLVDNLNFKLPMVDYDPPYVLEQGLRPTLAVMQEFGMTYGTNNKLQLMPNTTGFHALELPSGISPTVDVSELWMDDKCYVRIGGPAGGGTVFECENELGFIPYVWAAGETSSNPDPALQYLSVLYPYAGLEPWLNTMLSVLAAWGVIGGTPILYTSRKIPPGAGGTPDVAPQMADIPLGKRIDLGMGGEIGFVTPPPVGREVLEYIKFLTDFMDRAGLPDMAYGSIGTRTPGTAFQGALEQALEKVAPITRAVEGSMSEIVKMHWRMIERIGQPIVVTGIGLQPKGLLKKRELGRYAINPADIHGYYDLHSTIKVGNTQDLIAKGTHAAFMRAHKLWSRSRSMEYAGVDDTNQEYKDIMGDTLDESPLIQQITLMDALGQDPELQRRTEALAGQGVDIASLLTGMMGGAGAGGGGGPAAGTGPAPKRGGRPSGSPKNPGGARKNPQGSRGHG